MESARTMKELLEEILVALKTIGGAELVVALDEWRQERVLNCTEAAEFLGISRPTLRKYTEQGRVHKTVIGGREGYLRSDLLRMR